MARIGYGKIGRAIGLTPASWGVVGGDDEPPCLLKTLARRWPQHTWVILGRNSGEDPRDVGYPSNVVNAFPEIRDELRSTSKMHLNERAPALIRAWLPTFDSLDGVVMWLGQHGTSNYPIPMTDGSGKFTKPQDSFIQYAGPMIGGVNRWLTQDPTNRQVVWLCSDSRNYLKCRDLAWPARDVLGQHDFTRREKHFRYTLDGKPEDFGYVGDWVNGDPATKTWHVQQRYVYSGLEICGILPEHVPSDYSDDWESRESFGIFINETRAYVGNNRLDALRDYVLPLNPSFIHGKWSPKSVEAVRDLSGLTIESLPYEHYYDRLRDVRCTFTAPSSGSGWATAKPWQSFATGTVCFFHPKYDTNGHIIPTLEQVERGEVLNPELAQLARWLRVRDPADLAKRVSHLNADRDSWLWLTQVQRRLYDLVCEEPEILGHISSRARLEELP